MRSSRLLAVLLLCPISRLLAQAPDSRPSVAALDRVVAIGASLSSGFGNGFAPSRLLDQAITGKHQPVALDASEVFFISPDQVGEKQVTSALKRKATLVVGIDFLFWFSYGHMRGAGRVRVDGKVGREEKAGEVTQRQALLERGLKLLDKFDVPLVIGDLPDMWGADEAMLSPLQIPSEKTLSLLNDRIRAWAKTRGNVLVLPIARSVAQMRSGTLTLPEGAKADLASKQLLQGDRLHPTRLGVIAVVAHMVTEMRTWLGKGSEKALRFDAQAAIDEFAEER